MFYLWNTFTIDLFTDTVAILSLLDLKSIMGCSTGINTMRYALSIYARFSGQFSFKIS